MTHDSVRGDGVDRDGRDHEKKPECIHSFTFLAIATTERWRLHSLCLLLDTAENLMEALLQATPFMTHRVQRLGKRDRSAQTFF